jgi:HPr kinase/phosphorylase
MGQKELTVQQLFEDTSEILDLRWAAGRSGSLRVISTNDVYRPGLALTGFLDPFPCERVQILSDTEFRYLEQLTEKKRQSVMDTFFDFEMPTIICTSGNEPIPYMAEKAEEMELPILLSPHSSTEVGHLLSEYLDDWFAPTAVMHGTLVDVYGVGLLFTGRSGIGKSEIALDLVERGHRLVADDVVTLTRTARGVLTGMGNELLTHHMEIRGIGIIDIQSIFGIRGIRLRKRVEVEVVLKEWDEVDEVDRLGIVDRNTEILGVQIPQVTLPIVPGKNITVLAETIALSHMMKISGLNAAQSFDERLIDRMERKTRARQKLGEDYE